jgi:hypothetical protein
VRALPKKSLLIIHYLRNQRPVFNKIQKIIVFFTFFRPKIKQNGSTTPYIVYGADVSIKELPMQNSTRGHKIRLARGDGIAVDAISPSSSYVFIAMD